jgi:hypothetical protein
VSFVVALQKLMQAHGEPLPRFGADGSWGDESKAALDRLLNPPAIPDTYWPMLARIESGDRPYVKAKASSASGLFQFIKATWENEGGRWGANMSLAFGGLRPSVEEQLARAKTFTTKNMAYLLSHGLRINRATLYAAHFLGPAGAVRILRASPDTPLRDVTVANQRTANPSILGGDQRVSDFMDWLYAKTGDMP